MTTSWRVVPLEILVGNRGLFTDGDWILSENMDPEGEIRLIQLADIGVGHFLNKSARYITREKSHELKCTLLREGDILISRMADPIGRACQLPKLEHDAITAVDVSILRTDDRVAEPDFLTYYFNSPIFTAAAAAGASGTTRSRITRRNLGKIPVPLPPLSEQRRIVGTLKQADRLRQLRAEAVKGAERILPALFIKMFGDPAANPKGWPQGSLASFGNSVRYGLGQPPKASENGLPIIRATNIHAGSIYRKNMIFVNLENVPESRNALLSSNEVIVVRSGAYTGDVAQVTEDWQGAVVGYDLVVSPAKGWRGEFLEQYLLTPFIQSHYFASQKSRAGQPHLNATQLEATPTYYPPTQFQEKFACHVREIRRVRASAALCADQIDKIFSLLIARAFSGELTAKWREAHMKELLAEMERQAKLLNLLPPNAERQAVEA